jgi:hypothetical protein
MAFDLSSISRGKSDAPGEWRIHLNSAREASVPLSLELLA